MVRIPREKRRGSKIKASLSRAPKRLKLRGRVQGSILDANEGLQFLLCSIHTLFSLFSHQHQIDCALNYSLAIGYYLRTRRLHQAFTTVPLPGNRNGQYPHSSLHLLHISTALGRGHVPLAHVSTSRQKHQLTTTDEALWRGKR